MKRSSVVVQRKRLPTGLWYVEPYRKKGPHKNQPMKLETLLAALQEAKDLLRKE